MTARTADMAEGLGIQVHADPRGFVSTDSADWTPIATVVALAVALPALCFFKAKRSPALEARGVRQQ